MASPAGAGPCTSATRRSTISSLNCDLLRKSYKFDEVNANEDEDEDEDEDEKVDEAKRDLQHASQVWCELHGRPGTKEVGNTLDEFRQRGR